MSSIVFAHNQGLYLKGEIEVPSSKSVANRSLVLDFLCGFERFSTPLSSWSNDIRDMWNALNAVKKGESRIDIGESGTALRFLCSVLSVQEGKATELIGHGRISERPLKPLLMALEQMGADFKFQQTPYFAPLKIKGKKLTGTRINLPSNESSQYASSLLLIAPFIEGGLQLQFENEFKSASYLKLTTEVLKEYGVEIVEQQNNIEIKQSKLLPSSKQWPCDWSSIPYFLALAACTKDANLFIKNVTEDPLQADFVAVDLFNIHFNVECKFEKNGLHISKKQGTEKNNEINLNGSNFPDLVPTLFACAAFLNRTITINGIAHLRHKESDRISVLSSELMKVGFEIRQNTEDSWTGVPANLNLVYTPQFDSHHDHRMAMSFSIFSLKYDKVQISGAESINKSFPQYWKTLNELGIRFEIT